MAELSDDAIRRHAAKKHNAQVRLSIDTCAKLCALTFVSALFLLFWFPTTAIWWECAILLIISVGHFLLAHFLVRYNCSED